MLEQDSLEDIKTTTCPPSETRNDCLSTKLRETYLRAYRTRMEDSGIAGIQDEDYPKENNPEW